MESIRERIAKQQALDRTQELEEQKQIIVSEQEARKAKFAPIVESNEFTRRLIEEIQKTKTQVVVEHLTYMGFFGHFRKDTFSDNEYLHGNNRDMNHYYRLARKSAGWIIRDGLLDINSAERIPEQHAYDVLLTNEGRFFKKGMQPSEDNRFYVPYGAGETTVGIFNGTGASIDDVFPITDVEFGIDAYGFFVSETGNRYGDPNDSNYPEIAHKALTDRIREHASNHTHFFMDGSSFEEVV